MLYSSSCRNATASCNQKLSSDTCGNYLLTCWCKKEALPSSVQNKISSCSSDDKQFDNQTRQTENYTTSEAGPSKQNKFPISPKNERINFDDIIKNIDKEVSVLIKESDKLLQSNEKIHKDQKPVIAIDSENIYTIDKYGANEFVTEKSSIKDDGPLVKEKLCEMKYSRAIVSYSSSSDSLSEECSFVSDEDQRSNNVKIKVDEIDDSTCREIYLPKMENRLKLVLRSKRKENEEPETIVKKNRREHLSLSSPSKTSSVEVVPRKTCTDSHVGRNANESCVSTKKDSSNSNEPLENHSVLTKPEVTPINFSKIGRRLNCFKLAPSEVNAHMSVIRQELSNLESPSVENILSMLFPKYDQDIIEKLANSLEYKRSLRIGDRVFCGQGVTVALAKMAASRCALNKLFNIPVPNYCRWLDEGKGSTEEKLTLFCEDNAPTTENKILNSIAPNTRDIELVDIVHEESKRIALLGKMTKGARKNVNKRRCSVAVTTRRYQGPGVTKSQSTRSRPSLSMKNFHERNNSEITLSKKFKSANTSNEEAIRSDSVLTIVHYSRSVANKSIKTSSNVKPDQNQRNINVTSVNIKTEPRDEDENDIEIIYTNENLLEKQFKKEVVNAELERLKYFLNSYGEEPNGNLDLVISNSNDLSTPSCSDTKKRISLNGKRNMDGGTTNNISQSNYKRKSLCKIESIVSRNNNEVNPYENMGNIQPSSDCEVVSVIRNIPKMTRKKRYPKSKRCESSGMIENNHLKKYRKRKTSNSIFGDEAIIGVKTSKKARRKQMNHLSGKHEIIQKMNQHEQTQKSLGNLINYHNINARLTTFNFIPDILDMYVSEIYENLANLETSDLKNLWKLFYPKINHFTFKPSSNSLLYESSLVVKKRNFYGLGFNAKLAESAATRCALAYLLQIPLPSYCRWKDTRTVINNKTNLSAEHKSASSKPTTCPREKDIEVNKPKHRSAYSQTKNTASLIEKLLVVKPETTSTQFRANSNPTKQLLEESKVSKAKSASCSESKSSDSTLEKLFEENMEPKAKSASFSEAKPLENTNKNLLEKNKVPKTKSDFCSESKPLASAREKLLEESKVPKGKSASCYESKPFASAREKLLEESNVPKAKSVSCYESKPLPSAREKLLEESKVPKAKSAFCYEAKPLASGLEKLLEEIKVAKAKSAFCYEAKPLASGLEKLLEESKVPKAKSAFCYEAKPLANGLEKLLEESKVPKAKSAFCYEAKPLASGLEKLLEESKVTRNKLSSSCSEIKPMVFLKEIKLEVGTDI